MSDKKSEKYVVKYCDTEMKSAVPVSWIPKLKHTINPFKTMIVRDDHDRERTAFIDKLCGE